MDDSSVYCRASLGREAECRTIEFRGKDDLLISAEMRGPDSGQPVILLPGLGRTRRSWRSIALRLADDGYRVTSVDLRGHGSSGWPRDEDYSLRAFVDDLRSVMRQQGGQSVLIGASTGGVAALLLAAHEVAKGGIAGLGLVDISPAVPGDGVSSFERFMAECERGFDAIHEAGTKAANFFSGGLAREVPGELKDSLRRGDNGRWYWHWDPAIVCPRRDLSRGETRKIFSAISLVEVPTLLVTGASGDRFDREAIDVACAISSQVRWVDVSLKIETAPRPTMELAVPTLIEFIRSNWPN